MKPNFIYNPKSGNGRVKRILKRLCRYCDAHHIAYSVHPTLYAGHCRIIIGELQEIGERDFVLLGGDGTFHEALNGIRDFASARLLLIATGSGNDFVKCDKRLSQPPLTLLKNAIADKTRDIDYIEFADGTRCLNVAGTGLDIEVLLKARAYRRLSGQPRYLSALRRVVNRFEPYPLTVTCNGRTETYSAIMAGVCNGKRIGGGIKISPRSSIDDGKLNLVIVKQIERRSLKPLIPLFLLGLHIDKPYTVELLTDAVSISSTLDLSMQLDGEIYKRAFDCHIVKKGLTVFC